MSTFNLFSKRQKTLRGDIPDVFSYDELNQAFRIQVIHIIHDTFGEDKYSHSKAHDLYEFIHKTLCKEYGVFTLKKSARTAKEAISDYFLTTGNYEHCLDIIELSFKLIETYIANNHDNYKYCTNTNQTTDDAIKELNERFKEHAIGYEYIDLELIKVDSQFIHSEVIKPTLYLLKSNPLYKGANQEFLKSHDHYRHNRYKECLVDALKSVESLIKGICDQHQWPYGETDQAKKLINICLEKNLIPNYLQNQFSSLRILLESGIPTIRNKQGGHGQGADILDVPEYLASYALQLTATNLLFLMNCNENYSDNS